MTALLTNRNLLKQEPDNYYPTLGELDEFYGEPMEEAATITTTQSSTILSAPPVSFRIPFEAPASVTNVIPFPVVSLSLPQQFPLAQMQFLLKNASIFTMTASLPYHPVYSFK